MHSLSVPSVEPFLDQAFGHLAPHLVLPFGDLRQVEAHVLVGREGLEVLVQGPWEIQECLGCWEVLGVHLGPYHRGVSLAF